MVQSVQPYAVQHPQRNPVGNFRAGNPGGCSSYWTGLVEVEFLGCEGCMKADSLVVHSVHLPAEQSGELLRFTREQAAWEWMSFVVRRLQPGETLSLQTQGEEMGLVLL